MRAWTSTTNFGRRVLQRLAHLLVNAGNTVKLCAFGFAEFINDALTRQVFGQCSATPALAFIADTLFLGGRDRQIQHFAKQLGLCNAAFAAGAKLGVTQLEDLFVQGLDGCAVLHVKTGQQVLQKDTVVGQFSSIDGGQREHEFITVLAGKTLTKSIFKKQKNQRQKNISLSHQLTREISTDLNRLLLMGMPSSQAAS